MDGVKRCIFEITLVFIVFTVYTVRQERKVLLMATKAMNFRMDETEILDTSNLKENKEKEDPVGVCLSYRRFLLSRLRFSLVSSDL